jgi:threonine synthase
VAVDEGSITAMQTFAGSLGVGYVSPESAAALTAVPALLGSGEVKVDDEVVVFDCGIGEKYPPPPGPPDSRPRQLRPRRTGTADRKHHLVRFEQNALRPKANASAPPIPRTSAPP